MPVPHLGRPVIRALVGALVLAAATPATAGAQATPAPPVVTDDDRAYLAQLRRTDPAAYEKFVALRDARDTSFAEVVRLQNQLQAAGPELRGLVLPQLRSARRRYAESAMAFLDFVTARDRQTLKEYQEAIAQITALLEQRRRMREELERMRDEP